MSIDFSSFFSSNRPCNGPNLGRTDRFANNRNIANAVLLNGRYLHYMYFNNRYSWMKWDRVWTAEYISLSKLKKITRFFWNHAITKELSKFNLKYTSVQKCNWIKNPRENITIYLQLPCDLEKNLFVTICPSAIF